MSVWQVLTISVAVVGMAGLVMLAFVSRSKPARDERPGPGDHLTAIGSAPPSDAPAAETTDSWFWR